VFTVSNTHTRVHRRNGKKLNFLCTLQCKTSPKEVQFFTNFVSILCKNGYQFPGFETR